MLSVWGSESEAFASSHRAKLEAPGPLGPEASSEKCGGARSSSSHRDLTDLGTHLSREHRNPYVRHTDVHQSFGPLRDNNTAKALYLPTMDLSTSLQIFSFQLMVGAACLIDADQT
jgi:hypothetical protein